MVTNKKIKCWKKIGYASDGPAYQRKDTTSKRVIVDNRGNPIKPWFVETQKWSPTSGRSDSIIARETSKSKAIKKARAYMRKNDKC